MCACIWGKKLQKYHTKTHNFAVFQVKSVFSCFSNWDKGETILAKEANIYY